MLPLGEGRLVPPAVPRTGAVESKPTLRLLLHVDGGVLTDHHRVSGAVVVHLPGAQVEVATGRQLGIPFQNGAEHLEGYRHHSASQRHAAQTGQQVLGQQLVTSASAPSQPVDDRKCPRLGFLASLLQRHRYARPHAYEDGGREQEGADASSEDET
ncbi:hypothetical protein [Arthrobacter sp. Leaf69]|uniref:hypothetical protein n=1 Tax=Arthrobacter sp. Leaf69 TaxID=1736232 RepID=UPI0006F40470|nr:hypothetical protein [Arthrobacter sp. Leaf69]KQN86537.1 hypothetical protein ASE96_13290 [Arthrobacter sp. Leaf69]